MIGIEKFVVVDLCAFAKNPLPAGLVVRLRRAALDLVAQGVLALIGEGQVGVVQNQKTGREKNAAEKQRQGNAVQAEAAGLERHELVVLSHYAQRHQHGDERGEGRELVEEVAGQVQEIESDVEQAGPVLRDVVEQFKKREHFEEQYESYS